MVVDEPTILHLVERHLVRQGYTVDAAQNGVEAVEWISRATHDLILLDILMPEQDGITTYRQIMQRRPELGSRVVFATGDLATESTRVFLEETGAAFLAKPFDLSELGQLIRAAWRGAGREHTYPTCG